MERMTELLLNHAATLALTGPDAMPIEGVPDIPLLSPPVHRLVIFSVSLHGALVDWRHQCLVVFLRPQTCYDAHGTVA